MKECPTVGADEYGESEPRLALPLEVSQDTRTGSVKVTMSTAGFYYWHVLSYAVDADQDEEETANLRRAAMRCVEVVKDLEANLPQNPVTSPQPVQVVSKSRR